MKFSHGWYFPDGETHLIDWLNHPKNKLQMNGRAAYQGAKQMAAIELCEKRRTAVDIGGHIGLWSFNLAKSFEHVESFEPVAAHRACFEKNVDDPNVVLHACALGERRGSVSIHTAPTSSGDSWVDGTGNIPMERLDDVVMAPGIDFIKVDCEGYELHALRGAEGIIKESWPVICVEQKPGRAQKFGLPEIGAVDYLRSLGYRTHAVMSGDYLMVKA
jgi:FkbM family methyltransferase